VLGTTNTPGEFRQAALDTPLPVQIGDTVQVVGNQVIVSRAGSVVAVRSITGTFEPAPLGAERNELIDRVVFFWRPPVTGVVVTLVDVVKNTATGSITMKYSNGNQVEYTGGEQIKTTTDYLDTDPEVAQDILARKTILNSPDETNLTTCIGGKCSMDFTANAPVTLTLE
jgi:hypothetical protein